MEHELNILLIEDNPGDAFLIKFYLEESMLKNSRLVHAEFLKTALHLLSKNTYDVIILDLNLPDSHGIATLASVLEAKKDALAIVLTGLQDEELGSQAVKMGAQDFLVKGQFDGKVFTSSIRYAFESTRAKKELSKSVEYISQLEFRFNTVQQINKTGFWQINLTDKSAICSDYLIELLQLKNKIETCSDFLNLFDKNEQEKLNKLISSEKKNAETSLEVKLLNGKKATLTAKGTTPKESNIKVIAGILKLH
jgi:DNA-binding response OmpR family regulator